MHFPIIPNAILETFIFWIGERNFHMTCVWHAGNACEQNGYIKIALLDEFNNIIENYSLCDFDILENDETEKILEWKNNTNIDNDYIKMKIEMFKSEIFSFTGELQFFKETKKYTHLKYYYFEHTNCIRKEKFNDDNNKWVITKIPLKENQYAIELITNPIYKNKATIVDQKIKLSDNSIITINWNNIKFTEITNDIKINITIKDINARLRLVFFFVFLFANPNIILCISIDIFKNNCFFLFY